MSESTDASDPLVRKWQQITVISPYSRELGLQLHAVRPDWCVIRAPYDSRTVGNPQTGVVHGGVTNIGMRPTFGETVPTIETHVLDYSGNLYGQTVRLAFVQRLQRPGRVGGEERHGDLALEQPVPHLTAQHLPDQRPREAVDLHDALRQRELILRCQLGNHLNKSW